MAGISQSLQNLKGFLPVPEGIVGRNPEHLGSNQSSETTDVGVKCLDLHLTGHITHFRDVGQRSALREVVANATMPRLSAPAAINAAARATNV